jgi:hypothetical protein
VELDEGITTLSSDDVVVEAEGLASATGLVVVEMELDIDDKIVEEVEIKDGSELANGEKDEEMVEPSISKGLSSRGGGGGKISGAVSMGKRRGDADGLLLIGVNEGEICEWEVEVADVADEAEDRAGDVLLALNDQVPYFCCFSVTRSFVWRFRLLCLLLCFGCGG